MSIPNNIKKEHIFQAMLKINRDGIPPKRGVRGKRPTAPSMLE